MMFRLVFVGLIAINIAWFLAKPIVPELGVNWWSPLIIGFVAGLWLASEVEARD